MDFAERLNSKLLLNEFEHMLSQAVILELDEKGGITQSASEEPSKEKLAKNLLASILNPNPQFLKGACKRLIKLLNTTGLPSATAVIPKLEQWSQGQPVYHQIITALEPVYKELTGATEESALLRGIAKVQNKVAKPDEVVRQHIQQATAPKAPEDLEKIDPITDQEVDPDPIQPAETAPAESEESIPEVKPNLADTQTINPLTSVYGLPEKLEKSQDNADWDDLVGKTPAPETEVQETDLPPIEQRSAADLLGPETDDFAPEGAPLAPVAAQSQTPKVAPTLGPNPYELAPEKAPAPPQAASAPEPVEPMPYAEPAPIEAPTSPTNGLELAPEPLALADEEEITPSPELPQPKTVQVASAPEVQEVGIGDVKLGGDFDIIGPDGNAEGRRYVVQRLDPTAVKNLQAIKSGARRKAKILQQFSDSFVQAAQKNLAIGDYSKPVAATGAPLDDQLVVFNTRKQAEAARFAASKAAPVAPEPMQSEQPEQLTSAPQAAPTPQATPGVQPQPTQAPVRAPANKAAAGRQQGGHMKLAQYMQGIARKLAAVAEDNALSGITSWKLKLLKAFQDSAKFPVTLTPIVAKQAPAAISAASDRQIQQLVQSVVANLNTSKIKPFQQAYLQLLEKNPDIKQMITQLARHRDIGRFEQPASTDVPHQAAALADQAHNESIERNLNKLLFNEGVGSFLGGLVNKAGKYVAGGVSDFVKSATGTTGQPQAPQVKAQPRSADPWTAAIAAFKNPKTPGEPNSALFDFVMALPPNVRQPILQNLSTYAILVFTLQTLNKDPQAGAMIGLKTGVKPTGRTKPVDPLAAKSTELQDKAEQEILGGKAVPLTDEEKDILVKAGANKEKVDAQHSPADIAKLRQYVETIKKRRQPPPSDESAKTEPAAESVDRMGKFKLVESAAQYDRGLKPIDPSKLQVPGYNVDKDLFVAKYNMLKEMLDRAKNGLVTDEELREVNHIKKVRYYKGDTGILEYIASHITDPDDDEALGGPTGFLYEGKFYNRKPAVEFTKVSRGFESALDKALTEGWTVAQNSELTEEVALDVLLILKKELRKVDCILMSVPTFRFNLNGFDITNIEIKCTDPRKIIERLQGELPEVRYDFSNSPSVYAYLAVNAAVGERVRNELGLEIVHYDMRGEDDSSPGISIRKPQIELPVDETPETDMNDMMPDMFGATPAPGVPGAAPGADMAMQAPGADGSMQPPPTAPGAAGAPPAAGDELDNAIEGALTPGAPAPGQAPPI